MTTFPVWHQQDLIAFFAAEDNLNFQENYFKNPKSDIWFCAYIELAAKYFYQTYDYVEKKLKIDQDASYPILYEQGVPYLKLIVMLRTMLSKSGLDDINYFDLASPVKSRLCTILSSLLNRFRYNETDKIKLDEILQHEKEMDENEKFLRSIIIKNETMLENIKREQELLDEQERNYEKKFEEVLLQIKQEFRLQEEMNLPELEAEFRECEKAGVAKDEIIRTLQSQLNAAESKVVKSPARRMQTIDDYKKLSPILEQKVDTATGNLIKEREKLELCKDNFKQASDDIELLLKDLDIKIIENKEATTNILNQQALKTSHLEQLKSSRDNFKYRYDKVVDRIAQVCNDMANVQQNWRQKVEQLDRDMLERQIMISSVEDNIIRYDKKIEDLEADIKEDFQRAEELYERFLQLVKDAQKIIAAKYMELMKN